MASDSEAAKVPTINKARRVHFAGLSLLIVYVLVVYGPYLIGARYLDGRDLLDIFLPFKVFWKSSLLSGELPLWNPHSFCGFPFFANLQACLFYPLDWPALLMPVPLFYNWSVVVHVFLCGLGVYLLAWESFRDRAGAALAGLTFAGSSHVLGCVSDGRISHLVTYPWTAFVIYFFERWLRTRRPWCFAALVGALALQYLGGHLQFTIYSTYLILGYAAVRLYQDTRPKSAVTHSRYGAIAIVAAMVLGGLIASITLVPFAESISFMTGRSGGAVYEYATIDSLPLAHILTFLFPFAFGSPAKGTFWETTTGYSEIAGFVGVVPLVLGISALFLKGSWRMRWFWIIAAGLALLFALGANNPAYWLLYRFVPGISFLRNPARLLLIYSLAISMLAGWSVVQWRSAVRGKRLWMAPACFLVLSMILAAFALLFPEVLAERLQSMSVRRLMGAGVPIDQAFAASPLNMAQSWAGLWRGAVLQGLGWMLLIFLLALARERTHFASRRIMVLLIAVAAAEIALYATRIHLGVPAAQYSLNIYPEGVVADFLKERTREDPAIRFLNLDDTIAWNTRDLSPDFNPQRWMVYGLNGVRGYDSAILTHFSEFVNVAQRRAPGEHPRGKLFFPAYGGIDPGMRRLFAAKYILSRAGIPGLRLVHEDETGLKVFEDPEALPRAFFAADEQHLSTFVTARVVYQSNSRVDVEIDAPSAGYVVLLDADYPGWEVTVDGAPGVSERLGPFRKVQVGAGNRHVQWVLKPRSLRVGAALTGVGLLLLALYLYRASRQANLAKGAA